MRIRAHLPQMFFLFLLALVAAVALPTGTQPATAEEAGGDAGGEDDEPSDFWESDTSFSKEQVDKAITKGITYLKSQQQHNGSWGEIKGNASYGGGQASGPSSKPAGATALALFALLKCKVSVKDPAIKNGFKFLKKRYYEPDDSYDASMLLLAVTATADQYKTNTASEKAGDLGRIKLKGQYRTWASKLVDHLVKKRTARGWRYNHPGRSGSTPGGDEDLSSTQLSALALFAANRAGIKVKKKVWEDILSYSMDQQDDDGEEVKYPDPVRPKEVRTAKARGFAYIKGQEHPDEGQATGAMTACALANIEMARYVLSNGGTEKGIEKWNERPDAARVQESIYDGLAWIEKNWSPWANPKKRQMNVYHIYWLYALERAMDLFDLQRVGTHDWYNEGGQELLNRQHTEGYWKSGTTHLPEEVLDTSFALLFLKRSTAGQIPFGRVTGGSSEKPADNR